MTKKITYTASRPEQNTIQITATVDGVEAGTLTAIVEMGCMARQPDADVKKEYRGMGLYKTMILKMLTMFPEIKGYDSNNRNDNSNVIYMHWTGNDDLDVNDLVTVTHDGNGGLKFEIFED